MSNLHAPLLTGLSVVLTGSVVLAQAPPAQAPAQFMSQSLGVVVFPAKGQSARQQQTDESTCFTWAKNNTGFDPLAPPPASAATSSTPQQPASNPKANAPVRGTVGGAAAGAAIGAVAGDAGKGAAIGATAGLIGGVAARRRAEAAAQQEQAQATQTAETQQAAAAQDLAARKAGYNKAFSACMEGKGYTAK